MINTKTDFETIGMGFSLASGWVEIDGVNEWVVLTACAAGRTKKRNWAVFAEYTKDGVQHKAEAEVKDGYRYEAADVALAELIGA